MRVQCIINRCQDIPKNVYEGIYGYDINTVFDIEIGQLSVVYTITTIKKNLWFLVKADELPFPMYYPHQLFKIVDERISKYWIVKESFDDYDNRASVLKFGFKELVEDEFFYGEMLEYEATNLEIFNKYKVLMDNEY